MKESAGAHAYLHRISHRRIDPPAITAQTGLPQLLEETFLSYNAGRLREACRLFAVKMLAEDTTVGLSLSGALTPAGLVLRPSSLRWTNMPTTTSIIGQTGRSI